MADSTAQTTNSAIDDVAIYGLKVTFSPILLTFFSCNEHGTIYAISSDFGDRMTTQSMGLI